MYSALDTMPVVLYTGEPEGDECVPFWFSYVVYPTPTPLKYVAELGYN